MDMEIRSDNPERFDVSSSFIPMTSHESNESKIGNPSDENSQSYRFASQKIYVWKQFLASSVICVGSLVMGFVFGYTSGAMQSIMETIMKLSADDAQYIFTSLFLAALSGCLIGCPLIEFVGRRYTMIGAAVSCFIGWILIATATNIYMLCAGRIFCGFCFGLLYLATPIYLAESIQTEIRGTLGILPVVFGNTGMLLAHYIGGYLDWSKLAYLGAALPIVFFGVMLLIPETTRWYVTKGRYNDARRILQWFRGPNTNTEMEIQEIIQSQTESNKIGGRAFGNVFGMEYVHILGISVGLVVFSHLCGFITIVHFLWHSLIFAGISTDNIRKAYLVVGGLRIISSLLAVGLIDRLGRKMLLYVISITMMITLVIMGIYFYSKSDLLEDHSVFKWVPLGSLVIYTLGYFFGFGSISWFMVAEILPSKIRGTAAGFVSIFHWVYISLAGKHLRNIVESFKFHGTLWFYATMCFFALVFVRYFVPETRGKSLEKIEQEMTYDTRRLRLIDENRLDN